MSDDEDVSSCRCALRARCPSRATRHPPAPPARRQHCRTPSRCMKHPRARADAVVCAVRAQPEGDQEEEEAEEAQGSGSAGG